MDINIKLDIKGAQDLIKKAERQAPFAAMQATNDVLFKTRNRLVEVDSHRYLDDVTRWTSSRRALMVTKAKNKRNIYANIHIPKDRKYLEWVIFGGKSVPYKPGQEVLVEPAKGRLNKYKNIPRTYVKTRTKKDRFFVGKPSAKRPHGLYERTSKNNKLKMHVLLERKSRNQKRIFPADTLAAKYVQQYYQYQFRIRLQKALKTMR